MTVDLSQFLSREATLRKGSVMVGAKGDDLISLSLGLPSPACFPLKGITLDVQSPKSNFQQTETISRTIETHPDEIIESCQYMSSSGLKYFNQWIKQYVTDYFLPGYSEWDFIIQAGGTQSLDAIFRMLIDPGEDTALCETLTYPCFLETCVPLRIKTISIEMDENGIVPSKLEETLQNWNINETTKNLKKPKLIYLMPTGHNPTGITLSIERRRRIVELASIHNFLIVEDDPYYHLQLDENEHIPSLLKFDTEGRVIRIDSFSKMLMPGLRVSIVTANKLFIKKLSMHNELSIHSAAASSQLILQMIFSNWGETGFKDWLSHLQDLYRRRRDVLLNAFKKFIPHDLVTYNEPNYGMFLWINVNLDQFKKPQGSSLSDSKWATKVEDSVYNAALKCNVVLTKGHWFMHHKTMKIAGFRATYAFVDEDKMIKAAELLGKAIKNSYELLCNEK
ncbi:hypothetical protein CANINC_000010 [Pichia inconspicua]|uniref:Aminotransferase class I/classII large domain-containing protein n=1 Tax=Pichia inconspicua TaxID=52247 RepID=A0A4T0X766_9ASCO|nr:hypothetical protein CANINC_000010 [[Candida] inconspicua]